MILFSRELMDRSKIIHEGSYSFKSKWSNNSPHSPSIRVFQNNFYRWSETFETIAFAT